VHLNTAFILMPTCIDEWPGGLCNGHGICVSLINSTGNLECHMSFLPLGYLFRQPGVYVNTEAG
jgi:hypothetical protein